MTPLPARFRAAMAGFGLLLLASPALGQATTHIPAAAPIIFEDVHRLAALLRETTEGEDLAARLERDYFAAGSEGLEIYAGRYRLTPARLASAIAEHRERYAALEETAERLREQAPLIRAGFTMLKTYLPEATYPPTWIVVGNSGPGGVTRSQGLMIAAERFAERPGDIVPIILHELAHFQMVQLQGLETYRQIYGEEGRLIDLALREGIAELVAELTTGRHINPTAERYGLAHEAELWARFRADMNNAETSDWMFVDPENEAWPADLGYWIGYRIARHYYDNALDKRAALRRLLTATDYRRVLEESGYAAQVGD